MKYLGEKSLSSVLSLILKILWYLVLLGSFVAVIIAAIILFFVPPEHHAMIEICKEFKEGPDCVKNFPVVFKILIFPYFAIVATLTLKLINKAYILFTNLKNNIVFSKGNVELISKLAKLFIILSILTFDFSSLIISALLFILSEIFKNGTALQEENDLTI